MIVRAGHDASVFPTAATIWWYLGTKCLNVGGTRASRSSLTARSTNITLQLSPLLRFEELGVNCSGFSFVLKLAVR